MELITEVPEVIAQDVSLNLEQLLLNGEIYSSLMKSSYIISYSYIRELKREVSKLLIRKPCRLKVISGDNFKYDPLVNDYFECITSLGFNEMGGGGVKRDIDISFIESSLDKLRVIKPILEKKIRTELNSRPKYLSTKWKYALYRN